MKIVVIGGTGLIGSKLVTLLRAQGHDAVAASPNSGVNTLTGEGLDDVLEDASVVVDVSNSPSLEGEPALKFFETATRNLLAAEARAGVGHHVALSVVGTQSLAEAGSGYMRAKLAQESLIQGGPIPYTIIHATQFFEFVKGITDAATEGTTVHIAPVLFQPMAADDVADQVARVATGPPANRTLEVAGPESFRFDELIQMGLSARDDSRKVVADPAAPYFGALLSERSLVPGGGARLGKTRFEEWLAQPAGRR